MKAFKEVFTDQAAAPIGPYSQAALIEAGGGRWLISSGQIALRGQKLQGSSVAEQTAEVFKNIQAILSAEAMSLNHVIKTTVFLKDLKNFDEFNRIYGSFFKSSRPARSCIEAARLPKGALVEIEFIAFEKRAAKAP